MKVAARFDFQELLVAINFHPLNHLARSCKCFRQNLFSFAFMDKTRWLCIVFADNEEWLCLIALNCIGPQFFRRLPIRFSMQCTHHTHRHTHSDPYDFHAFGLCIVFVFVGGPRGKTVFSLFYASQPIKMSIVWYGVSNTINTRAEHIFHLALLSLNAVRILQTQRTAATPIRNPYLSLSPTTDTDTWSLTIAWIQCDETNVSRRALFWFLPTAGQQRKWNGKNALFFVCIFHIGLCALVHQIGKFCIHPHKHP